MTDNSEVDQLFIRKLTGIILANLDNENFGVKELIHESGMNYSGLSQRLKAISNKTINQFIREVRLQKALEMLREGKITAAEIAYKTGFSSPAYFNTCFHDFFGFPPGHVKKEKSENPPGIIPGRITPKYEQKRLSRLKIILTSIVIFSLIVIIYLAYTSFLKNNSARKTYSADNQQKSIIVLPFRNLSNDPGNQYFADGVMKEILNNLYHIKEFRIISGTTAERFRVSDLNSSEIARKLKVNYSLEGEVFKSQDKIRIFVRLIDAGDDNILLSEMYEKDIKDIFSVQSNIALEIANTLKTKLSTEEVEVIKKIPTKNINAYNNYLFGRYFLNKNPQESNLNKSIEYFEKSIKQDPKFAPAYAAMAKAYMWLAHYGYIPWLEGRRKTRDLAEEAIKIDKNNSDAHFILGYLARYDFEWEESMKEFRLAIDYEPDNPNGHFGYSMVLFALGKLDEAREQINIAKELDPLSLEILEESAFIYRDESKPDGMLNDLIKMHEINSGYASQYLAFHSYCIIIGDTTGAVKNLKKFSDIDPAYKKYGSELMNIYKKSGYYAAMEYWLKAVTVNKNMVHIAAWNASLNRKEEALTYLEKAYEEQHSMLYVIYYAIPFWTLRSEPRFQAIIEKMGLSSYIKESSDITD